MEKQYTVDDLFKILKALRGENGCPWDKVQTHESMKTNMIEEAYEAVDAINSGNDASFANELGDVFLQVAFHSLIASERGAFNFNTVLNELCNKLISRHTHVFGNDKASDAESALANWDKNKKKEKKLNTATDTLNDVPHHFPALLRAQKVQKRASKVGFDFKDYEEAENKLYEEIKELDEARKTDNKSSIYEEYSDLLFSVVNLARFLNIDSETCLIDGIDKFITRFGKMENEIIKNNSEICTENLDEMNEIWDKNKLKDE